MVKTHKMLYDMGEKGGRDVNVLLVRPRTLNLMTIFGAIVCKPLELEYLLSACRAAEAEPFLYDGVTEARRFSHVLRDIEPRLVAITGYLTQEREMREYARLAKVFCPGCTVVIGGVHARLNHRRLYWPEVDKVSCQALVRAYYNKPFMIGLYHSECHETPCGTEGKKDRPLESLAIPSFPQKTVLVRQKGLPRGFIAVISGPLIQLPLPNYNLT